MLYAYSALEGFGNHYVDLLEATATLSVKRRAEDVSIAQPEMIERLSVGQKLDLVVLLATGGRAGRVGRPWSVEQPVDHALGHAATRRPTG